jgi:DNA-binding Lrp family transcriptional regulator
MTDYLVLVRLSPSKMQEAIGAVRNLPEKPISGVDLCYTMNIFGSWDLGVLIDAENTSQAQEFVQKKIKDISGVTDVYTLPTFPHGNGLTNQKDIEPEDPTQNESGKKRQHRG